MVRSELSDVRPGSRIERDIHILIPLGLAQYNARNVELFVNVDFKIATFTSAQREGISESNPGTHLGH